MDEPCLPPVPVCLGYLALVPFVVAAAAVWIAPRMAQDQAAVALSAYAATVVSFLGGVHWGFGFRNSQVSTGLFVWGVVPALVAWAALLLPVTAALAVHSVTLLTCFLVDRMVYPRHGAGAWLPLRARLTAIAVPACLVGSWGALQWR